MSQKICEQCGTAVEEQKAVAKSDKLFCSETHAQKYEEKSEDKCGCCC